MPPSSLSKLAVRAARQSIPRHTTVVRSSLLRPICSSICNGSASSIQGPRASNLSSRAFSTTRPVYKGGVPAELTNERYHQLADDYLNSLIEKLEQLQEETEDVDCEYSAGVLTLGFEPNGTYVINKQPPNKQIWLSSPISGPKRYDYVVSSEGQDAKEGTGAGEWVYLRDGSTLTELLAKELGVDMSEPYAPVPHKGD